MSVRVLGAALVVLLLGAAGGYAYAATRTDEPVPIAAEPVAAKDPRLPVETVRPDPDDPALQTGVELRSTTLVLREDPDAPGPPTRRLQLEVPRGWILTRPSLTRWTFRPPDVPPGVYGLRVDLPLEDDLTVDAAIRSRASALRSAFAQGFLDDLRIDEVSDGFEASYVNGEDFLEISLERFFSGPDPTVVYATVAASGRERDRAGLSDLLERISITLRTG